jgi:hypothetical protein
VAGVEPGELREEIRVPGPQIILGEDEQIICAVQLREQFMRMEAEHARVVGRDLHDGGGVRGAELGREQRMAGNGEDGDVDLIARAGLALEAAARDVERRRAPVQPAIGLHDLRHDPGAVAATALVGGVVARLPAAAEEMDDGHQDTHGSDACLLWRGTGWHELPGAGWWLCTEGGCGSSGVVWPRSGCAQSDMIGDRLLSTHCRHFAVAECWTHFTLATALGCYAAC